MKEEKRLYKSIPASESGSIVTCNAKDGEYVITNCPEKQRFTLWKIGDGFEKLAVSDSPIPLYEKIPSFTDHF